MKKIVLRIVTVFLLLLLVLMTAVILIARRNQESVRENIATGLEALSSKYTIVPVDSGDFTEVGFLPFVKYDVQQYTVEELGNLCVMTMNIGFMQRTSFVVTPSEKDMPLLSAEYVYLPWKKKVCIDFYDLTADKDAPAYKAVLDALEKTVQKEEFRAAADIERSASWYTQACTVSVSKQGSDADLLNSLFDECVKEYVLQSELLPVLTRAEKEVKVSRIRDYTANVAEKGGLSADIVSVFLESEKEQRFFDTVLFGTGK